MYCVLYKCIRPSDGTNVGMGLRLMLMRLLMPLMTENLKWDLQIANQIQRDD